MNQEMQEVNLAPRQAWQEEADFWYKRIVQGPWVAALLFLLTLAGGVAVARQYWAAAPAEQTALIRWHFYANSDGAEDQMAKIAVKEAVMAQAGLLFSQAETLEECRQILQENLPLLYQEACRVLAQEAEGQGIRIYYEPQYFTEKQIGSRILPAGKYETVSFILGAGAGSNWWCLLYPALTPGQKVMFTDVPQSEVTSRAQAAYGARGGDTLAVGKGVSSSTAHIPSQGEIPVQCHWKVLDLLGMASKP